DKQIDAGHKFGKDRNWKDAVSTFRDAEKTALQAGDKRGQGQAALQQALHLRLWRANPGALDPEKLKPEEIAAYQRATDLLEQGNRTLKYREIAISGGRGGPGRGSRRSTRPASACRQCRPSSWSAPA